LYRSAFGLGCGRAFRTKLIHLLLRQTLDPDDLFEAVLALINSSSFAWIFCTISILRVLDQEDH
jgi:hypothetical protein